MKQKYAKLLAALCVLALALSMMPAAFAAETPTLEITGAGKDNTLSFEGVYGHDPIAGQEFTVTAKNMGKDAKTTVKVSNSSFTVSPEKDITFSNNSATIKVTPKTGLSAGNHSATVTISMTGAKDVTVSVKLTVAKHDGLKSNDCYTSYLSKAGTTYKMKGTDGVQLIKGRVEVKQEIGSKFPNDTFSFVYGCAKQKDGANGVTVWKTKAEDVKATEAGTYDIYYMPVESKNFKAGEAIKVNDLSGIEVTDDRFTITLDPGDEIFELNATTELKTGYDHKLPSDAKLPTYNQTANKKVIGWYTTKDPKDKTAKKVDSSYVFKESTTIYAAWSDAYTTSDVNVLCYADAKKEEAVRMGVARVDGNGTFLRWVTEPSDPVRAGSTFRGWATSDGTAIKAGETKLTMNQELYALWGDKDGSGSIDGPVDIPYRPVNPNPPSGSSGTLDPSTVLGAAYVKELRSQNWDVLSVATTSAAPVYTYKMPNGTMASGSCWVEGADGVGHRYIFNNYGVLQTGQNTASNMTVTGDGDILMNGNLYYLNPNRNLNDPRTCYVMTNYVRKRPNYGDQTYYDQDGITFEGWMKNANGGLRYQTCLRQPGQATDRYLIVWRAQTLPACQHPDHPGDPAYTLPAGRYFFDDDGVLVTREGWNDGKDGKEYYTNAYGQITNERTK